MLRGAGNVKEHTLIYGVMSCVSALSLFPTDSTPATPKVKQYQHTNMSGVGKA